MARHNIFSGLSLVLSLRADFVCPLLLELGELGLSYPFST